jgi:hypothetical protein
MDDDWFVAPPPSSELDLLPPPPPPPPVSGLSMLPPPPPARRPAAEPVAPAALAEIPRHIVGPISLTEHYRPAPVRAGRGAHQSQHIYVFGETHVHQSTCPYQLKIHQYLRQVIDSNRDKKLDLFIEVPIIGRLHSDRPEVARAQSYLDRVQQTFEACLQLDKTQCPYHGHVRFHYVDVRWTPALEWLTVLWETMLTWHDHLRTQQRQIQFQRRLAVLDRLVSTRPYVSATKDPLHDVDWIQLVRQTKLDKQLSRIPDPTTRLKVQAYFQPRMKRHATVVSEYEYGDIRELLNLPASDMPNDTLDAFARLMLAIGDLLMDYTDCYTIARMLRTFRDTDTVMQHILFYGGNEHANTLRSVLAKVGFEQVAASFSNSPGVDYQCLDLSPFHQPLFR